MDATPFRNLFAALAALVRQRVPYRLWRGHVLTGVILYVIGASSVLAQVTGGGGPGPGWDDLAGWLWGALTAVLGLVVTAIGAYVRGLGRDLTEISLRQYEADVRAAERWGDYHTRAETNQLISELRCEMRDGFARVEKRLDALHAPSSFTARTPRNPHE